MNNYVFSQSVRLRYSALFHIFTVFRYPSELSIYNLFITTYDNVASENWKSSTSLVTCAKLLTPVKMSPHRLINTNDNVAKITGVAS